MLGGGLKINYMSCGTCYKNWTQKVNNEKGEKEYFDARGFQLFFTDFFVKVFSGFWGALKPNFFISY